MDGSVLMNRDLVDRLEQKFERAINDRITPLVQRIATLEDEIEHLKARISGDGGHKRPSTGRSDEEVSNDATFGQSTGLSKSHDDDLANETGDMDEEEEQGADAEFVNNSQLLNVGNKKPRLKYGISTCKAKKAFDAESFCDVADTLMSCERIVFIVGAGISASCGISTFRGEGGLYDKIDSDRKLKKQLGITKKKADGSFFTKKNFRKDPWNFMWKWSTRHYDDSLRPGPTHNFLAWLESKNKLLRVYTTNSDGLELAAGVSAELVIHAHGTMARGYCMECGKEGDTITTVIQKEEIAKFLKKDKVPMCRHFDRNGKLIGPEPKGRGAKRCTDVVLFQEDINPDVDKALRSSDYENADAVVVMGTSLSVDPMMYVPDEFPSNIPKILINQEYVQMAAEYGKPQDWTAFTLGESDAIVTKLKERMME